MAPPSRVTAHTYANVALDDEDVEQFKGHAQPRYRRYLRCSRATFVWCLLTLTLAIIATIAALMLAPSLRLRLVKWVGGSEVKTVREFLALSVTPAFFREHGVPVTSGHARVSLVALSAIDRLTEFVSVNGIVDGYDSTLMIGIVNHGYLSHALNWLCFTRRHNLTNFVLGAIDRESVNELTLLGYGRHVLSLSELFDDDSHAHCGGHTGAHEYRSQCFNRATRMKAQLVLTALLSGYHVLLADMDLSFIHNPFLYLPLSHDWEMQLEPHEFCTGLYYNRASSAMIAMQSAVLMGIATRPTMDDQVIYNDWIKYHRTVNRTHIDHLLFPLAPELFPIGQRFGVHSAIVLHNNWVKNAAEKFQKASNLRLWLYNNASTLAAKRSTLQSLRIGYDEFESDALTAEHRRLLAAPRSSLLQCETCTVCNQFVPSVPALRDSFPGQLKTGDFSAYRGTLSEKHTWRDYYA